jgi:hypothetical protein
VLGRGVCVWFSCCFWLDSLCFCGGVELLGVAGGWVCAPRPFFFVLMMVAVPGGPAPGWWGVAGVVSRGDGTRTERRWESPCPSAWCSVCQCGGGDVVVCELGECSHLSGQTLGGGAARGLNWVLALPGSHKDG